MASTSLQYAQDWKRLARRLVDASARYLFITGLPTVLTAGDFVFGQDARSYGYATGYPSWCLNQRTFVETIEAMGVSLVRAYAVGHLLDIQQAPEQVRYMGFLFRVARACP
jgi:hypothetical protein